MQFSIPLYRDGKSIWREGLDSAGAIDVVALQLERAALPKTLLLHAFTPAHLVGRLDQVEMGTSVLIVGFPLGVHDTLHRLPVARQSVIASAFGIRFQGKGYFLTDARLHRGTSGAPVVARKAAPRDGRAEFPWLLLGVHCVAPRRRQPRRQPGRKPRPELRLVRGHPHDPDAAGRSRAAPRHNPARMPREPARRLPAGHRPLRRDARGAARRRARTGSAMFEQLAATRAGSACASALQWVQRQVRENGVTYNVYADPRAPTAPGSSTCCRSSCPHEEWAGIEAAIAQRATLLNRVLVDVYGEQRLLQEGLLPPALVYGHAGFLRPCRGIAGARRRDAAPVRRRPRALARRPLVGDRRPHAGALGRGLRAREPPRHLAPVPGPVPRPARCSAWPRFFATLRDSLAHWAPADGAAPLTVLLTPGPHNETYFEHTYLARYLGIPLVEGSDLTVRDGKVWLKTLSGLQRVHAILRRLDDDYCDPLELRSDSALGIAGPGRRGAPRQRAGGQRARLEPARDRARCSASCRGLCERLLGETLKMPSVATWWCGEPAALADVIGQARPRW